MSCTINSCLCRTQESKCAQIWNCRCHCHGNLCCRLCHHRILWLPYLWHQSSKWCAAKLSPLRCFGELCKGDVVSDSLIHWCCGRFLWKVQCSTILRTTNFIFLFYFYFLSLFFFSGKVSELPQWIRDSLPLTHRCVVWKIKSSSWIQSLQCNFILVRHVLFAKTKN